MVAVIRCRYDPTPAAFARGARFQTFETNFGPGRTWWHGIDVTANARLGAGVNIQGARALDACRIDARRWSNRQSGSTRLRGNRAMDHRGPRLANYTIRKSMSGERSLPLAAHHDPLPASQQLGHQRASLAANYNVPNTVVQSLLGRLPSGSMRMAPRR